MTVAEVARRQEVSRGVVWTWRRQVRRGLLQAPVFLPVRVMDEPMAGDPASARSSTASNRVAARDARVEITLADGTTIRASSSHWDGIRTYVSGWIMWRDLKKSRCSTAIARIAAT